MTTVEDRDEAQQGLPLLVSLDDHLVEPPQLWVERLPARYREAGPHVVRERIAEATRPGYLTSYDGAQVGTAGDRPGGSSAGGPEWVDVWHYEDLRIPMLFGGAVAGRNVDEATVSPFATYDDLRPGFFQAKERVEDMAVDGVDVSLCFPNLFLRFCGQRFLQGEDKELALLCVQAYNDWLLEEWAGQSEGHLYGAMLIPLWDPTAAAAEVRRNAAGGCKAVCFSEIPYRLGLPSMYSGEWDPFFAACEETGMVIMIHIGSSSTIPQTSPDSPSVVRFANEFGHSSLSLTDWILSGQFDKYPGLRIAFAEGQAGWIPFIVTRLDNVWRKWKRSFVPAGGDAPLLKEQPSSYLRDHVYPLVFDDRTLLPYIDLFGVENLCFETDYPHSDGSWPESRQAARALTEGLSDELRVKILRDNGLTLLGLRS
jgi:predicted TIM-barrel fold metal-dependent hydrolase